MALLTLKDIGKIYVSEGNVAVGIRGVNLSFDRGEFVAVTGKSGSGKSTLLNVISGMDTYEEGELLIEGQATSHYLQPDWEEYRAKYISFIFQDYNIIDSFTVLQNVELALMHIADRKERRRRAMELIERVGLKAHVRHKGSKLSGGQKQRTVIARALAKDSPIILADEPTGNLDSTTSAEIIELLREVSKDKLLIVVTHNFDQVKDAATRHVRIYDGAVESDTAIAPRRESEQASREEAPKKRVSSLRNGITLGLSMFTSRPRLSLFLCLLMLVGNLGVFLMTASSGEAKELFTDSSMFRHINGRVVLVKRSGEVISEEELTALSTELGALSYLHYDRLLDEGHYYNYCNNARVRLLYTYNERFGSDIFGRYPEARDEIFLYLPISCQTVFGTEEPTNDMILTLERLPFRVVGWKYYYDNNQDGRILFHREGFRTVTAAYSLLSRSSFQMTGALYSEDGLYEKNLHPDDIYPYFSMEGNTVYIADKSYRSELKRLQSDTGYHTEVQFSSTYYSYNYNHSAGDTVSSYQRTFTDADLTDVDPGKPVRTDYFNVQGSDLMHSEIADGYSEGSYLAVSADYITLMGEEFLERSYRQASLFFGSDKVAELALPALAEKGYIAVLSNETYTPDPFDTILNTLAAVFAVIIWLAVIVFIAFFINLCSFRSLSAFKSDMAIMRSMGIPVKVIRIGMYVRMLISLIPAYVLVSLTSVLIFRSPEMNGQFVYLYPWQYALMFLGMLLLTARVTHNQIKKLFGESVKKSLKGGNVA